MLIVKWFLALVAALSFVAAVAAFVGFVDRKGSERAEELHRRAAQANTVRPAKDWGGAVYSYTDPRSGQRYLIVSTGYHGGVTMIKAEPDKLPEAK